MKVSVVTTTFRPGGLDIILAGMRDQTFKDFELIIVDNRYEKRHDDVVKLAAEYKVPTIHVPEHRRNGKWTTFCSAWNTGFALAQGEYILICQDYAWCPPNWIEAYVKALDSDPNRYYVGPYIYTAMPAMKTRGPYDFAVQMSRGNRCTEPDKVLAGDILPEMFAFESGPFSPAWVPDLTPSPHPDQDVRTQVRPEPGHPETSWIHVKNEACTRELMHKLNGLDERLERGKGPMDINLAIRVLNAGTPLWWDPALPPQIVPNPRHYIRTMPWGDMDERLEGRWSYRDGEAYNVRCQSEGLVAARNTLTLEGLEEVIGHWRLRLPGSRPESWDVTDKEYWGTEIWPDSP